MFNVSHYWQTFIYNKTYLEFKSILINKTSSDEADPFMIVREF